MGTRKNDKKYLYDGDFCILDKVWKSKNVASRRTIDLQIMDLSDEIAYAAHDLEDSLAMGYMSIGELLHEFKHSSDFSGAFDAIEKTIKDVQNKLGEGKSSSEVYSSIVRKEITSCIVNELVRDIGIIYDEGVEMLGFSTKKHLSKGLKSLVFDSILRKQNIQLYEKMGEKVILGLYDVYSDERFNKDRLLLPVEYRIEDSKDSKDSKECKRRIIDYISGMMDSYAISEYKKYFGASSLDILYEISPN